MIIHRMKIKWSNEQHADCMKNKNMKQKYHKTNTEKKDNKKMQPKENNKTTLDGGQAMGEDLRHVQMSRWDKHTGKGSGSEQQ